ncbi:MAG: OmpA family protein [Runella sp.]
MFTFLILFDLGHRRLNVFLALVVCLGKTWGQQFPTPDDVRIPQLSPLNAPAATELQLSEKLVLTRNNLPKDDLSLPSSLRAAVSDSRIPLNVFVCRAFDHRTGQATKATFRIKSDAGEFFEGVSTPQSPYQFVLNRGSVLTIEVMAEGFATAKEDKPIELGEVSKRFDCTARLLRLQVNSELVSGASASVSAPNSSASILPSKTPSFEEMTTGKAIRLDKIYFDQSSYILRPDSYPQLDELAKVLMAKPKLLIEIGGHTDALGDQRLNDALSENRAKVVVNYLTRKGVPEKQLRYKGYGSRQPVSTQSNEQSRQQNRRVEVKVLAQE